MRFVRTVGGVEVVLDVMVGPLGAHSTVVITSDTRIRPKGLEAEQGLHARRTDDAVGVEQTPLRLTVRGLRSNGAAGECGVLIPRAFPYALMKLGALRDRIHDADKQEGRHHAMDLYRIVGMLTEEEAESSARIARTHAHDPEIAQAHRTIDLLLAPRDGLGRLRLLEYQRMNRPSVPEVEPDLLVEELRRLLSPPTE
jgi:hypothetical protein